MEPVCEYKLLRGQQLVNNIYFNFFLSFKFSNLNIYFYYVVCGLDAFIGNNLKPNAVPALRG